MKKKIIIAAIISVVIIAGVTTSIFIIKGKKSKPKDTVKATFTDYILQSADNFEYSTLTGKVYSGGSQNVYLSDGDTLGQILVNTGDSVDIGTPLITLDTNKLKLELDSCNLKVQQDDININTTTKLLTKYQNAVPMSETPDEPSTDPDEPDVPDEPDTPDTPAIDPSTILKSVDSLKSSIEGDGSEDNPFTFRCSGDCVINSNIFKNIIKNHYTVRLYIYSEDLEDFQYTCILSYPEAPVKINSNYKWSVGKIQTLSDGTNLIQLNDEQPLVQCDFSVYTSPDDSDIDNGSGSDDSDDGNTDDIDDSDIDDSDIDDISGSDTGIDNDTGSDDSDNADVSGNIDKKYTKQELADLITENQKHLTELQLQKREDQISVRKAQSKYDAATVTSTMKGVITAVNPDASASEPLVTVAAGNGLYVTTVVDEYSYSSTKVGDKLTLTTWSDTGETTKDATITDISRYPSTSEQFSYSSNPNVSYYPVTAYIEDSTGFKDGDYVTVSMEKDDNSSSYYVEGAYLGKDKKGAFLYVAKDDYILHKKYITTGKTMYGYTEIKDFKPDKYTYIASPYSKNAKAGAKVKPDEEY